MTNLTLNHPCPQDEERLPYDIPLPEKPNRLRLVCGRCCNDGLDELERLAAHAGSPLWRPTAG
jgi:hypothetical protein